MGWSIKNAGKGALVGGLPGAIAAATPGGGKKITQFEKWGDQVGQKVKNGVKKVGDYVFGSGGGAGGGGPSAGEAGMANAEEERKKALDFYREKMMKGVTAQTVTADTNFATAQAQNADRIDAQQIDGTSYEATESEQAQIAAQREAEAATIDRTDSDEFRASQLQSANELQNGPLVSEQIGQRQSEDAIKRALSAQASARGGNVALNTRAGMQMAAEDIQKIGAQTQLASIQERNQNLNTAAGIASQGRAQDLDFAKAQAQYQQEAGMYNATATNQQNLAQSQLDQQRNLFNAAAFNDSSKFTAETSFQAAKANQSADLQAQIQNGLNQIDVSKFNTAAQNQMNQFKTDAKLRADVANQAADLQAKGMSLDAVAKSMGYEMDSIKSLLGASTAVAQMDAAARQQQSEQEAKKKAGIIGGVMGAVSSWFGGGSK